MRTVLPAAVAAMIALTGCAGSKHAQEISRLRSEVSLLGERVGQIERTSLASTNLGSTWPDSLTQPASRGSSTRSSASLDAASKPAKKEIQQALQNAGFYEGPIDGKIGPKSKAAIREFQRVNGLKADGVVGRRTWEKLGPYLDLGGSSAELSLPAETVIK